MSTFDLLADLPLEVDGYTLEGKRAEVSSGFERLSTIVHLQGGRLEGVGEDVVYDALDHIAFQDAGPVHALAGRYALGEFCELIDGLDLFAVEPVREVSRLYRRWTFHSAALDLALQQADQPLHEALDREPRPVTFVVSLRLGEPPTLDPIERRLSHYPTLRFKLDPTSSWTPELIAALVATDAVDSVDFKSLYRGTVVDQPPDPVLYERVVDAFPDRLAGRSGRGHGGDGSGARRRPRPDHLGRTDPLDRRYRVTTVPAQDGQHQAFADRWPVEALRDV